MDGALRETEEGVTIQLAVTPNAKRTEVVGYSEWKRAVEIRISSPPKGGKANAELIEFLRGLFGKPVEIVRGERSTNKVVLVRGLSKEDALEILRNVSKQR